MFNRSKSSSCRVVVVGPVVVLVSPQVVWFCSKGWNRNNIKTHVISPHTKNVLNINVVLDINKYTEEHPKLYP